MSRTLLFVFCLMSTACVSVRPGSPTPLSATGAIGASALACAVSAAEKQGYHVVRRPDDAIIMAKSRSANIAKSALTRVVSLGFTSGDVGREDRFIMTQSANTLRIDAVGTIGTGSDVPATDAGREDARAIISTCSEGSIGRVALAD
jgi:hypothetical protein